MPESKHKRRWFHLSPDRFIVGLLAVEGFLFLSEQFQWFAFNEKKGWTVLIAVAAVCVVVVVMVLWLVLSLLFRWRFQFSLRSLVVLVVAVAVPLGWFALKMREAERQRRAVEAIGEAGWQCYYFDKEGMPDSPLVRVEIWMAESVGWDLIWDVVHIETRVDSTSRDVKHLLGLTDLETDKGLDDRVLEHLAGLTELETVVIAYGQVTDVGLAHLRGLTELSYLNLRGTHVTEQGVRELQKALPNCEIVWDNPTTTPKTNPDPIKELFKGLPALRANEKPQPRDEIAVFRHHPALPKDDDGAAHDAQLVYAKAREHRLNGVIDGGLGRGYDFWIARENLPIWEAVVDELKDEGSLTYYVPGEVDDSGCGFLPIPPLPPQHNHDQP
ncbi:MAG: hypothetical protein ISR77_03145 [Pirellulaceae bacterium]|nr:hypothetical protein [Pirellulaceae bacterium]